MSDTILSQLQTAAKGLLYPSEQDNPIKAFVWPQSGAGAGALTDIVKKQAKAAASDAVETQSVEEFFAPLTTPQDWYGEEEKKSLAQAQQLAETVKKLLSDIQVVRVGDTDKKVYVVGKTEQGDLAGVTTKVVET